MTNRLFKQTKLCRRFNRFIFTGSIFLALLTGYDVGAQTRADYLILINPGKIRLLNQYQMALPKDHTLIAMPEIPLKILAKKMLLSDGISQAMQVEFLHEVFFLLIDEQGNPLGMESGSDMIRLNNCRELSDTIRVTSPRIQIRRNRSAGSSSFSASEQNFIRLFQKNGDYALLPINPPRQLLWSRLSPASGWQRYQAQQPATVSHQNAYRNTAKKIIALFDKTNHIYQIHFQAFNKQFSESRPAPYWLTSQNDQLIRADLTGMDAAQLTHSTDALIKELGLLLAGTPFQMSYTDDSIIIKKNRR